MIEFRPLPDDHHDLAHSPMLRAALLIETREDGPCKHVCHVFKTPLWRSALKLDTDNMLRPIAMQ